MAHPLFWPGRYYYYPFGNTSAVSFTRDLALEDPAHILCLGCGDPRNILYTVYCEHREAERKLDFTCCDQDPAVLARNALLLTMIVDGQSPRTAIWNIWFHIYLDATSLAALQQQCKKLLECSDSIERWNASPYAHFLTMCTEYTLVEIRQHWSLYLGMQDLPRSKMEAIQNSFSEQFRDRSEADHVSINLSSARSAGPLYLEAIAVCSQHYRHFWKTGITSTDKSQISSATHLNPTMVYSLGGDSCSVQYGLDPLVAFHLSGIYGKVNHDVTVEHIVEGAKDELKEWCEAFCSLASPGSPRSPILRFVVGDAIAVCHALRSFSRTGSLATGMTIRPWTSHRIELSEVTYQEAAAPTAFNVIDTSNLDDHISLLNVMIITIPLLSTVVPSILYTESLLFSGTNPVKEYRKRLNADITVVSIILGLVPIDHLSGFTARSNRHELLLRTVHHSSLAQYHQVTTWKSPVSGDTLATSVGFDSQRPAFEPSQLAALLWSVYCELFEQEDPGAFFRLNKGNEKKAIETAGLVHYMRETFAYFLKVVSERLDMGTELWTETMNTFLELQLAAHSQGLMPINQNHSQEFYAHLHRLHVFTAPFFVQPQKIGRFADWKTIPVLVRIFLVVPREKLLFLDGTEHPTPILQCDIRGGITHNIFSAIQAAFGEVTQRGSGDNAYVVFREDRDGWTKSSTSPCVVSFVMPSQLLTKNERPERMTVGISLREHADTMDLQRGLGPKLILFSAKLMDRSRVIVIPEHPISPARLLKAPATPPSSSRILSQIGKTSTPRVELDEKCASVKLLVERVDVEDDEAKSRLTAGVNPGVKQISPCVIRVTIANKVQDLVYPFPVIGKRNKLRVARKSLFVEVLVPVSGPFQPEGMWLNPFPIIGSEGALAPWNLHRVNLPRLPVLEIGAKNVDRWLRPHINTMLSARDRDEHRRSKNDDLYEIKNTLHSLMLRCAGLVPTEKNIQRVFALRDKATTESDTVFFVSDLRIDVQAHTIVCDGYVLPLTPELMSRITGKFGKLVREDHICNFSSSEGETRGWKRLLPALVERCRVSWRHTPDCEYKTNKKIPLSDEMHKNPICSCGMGKDVEGMNRSEAWKGLAPYVTKVALSPLFAVSYLETIVPEACFRCGSKGKPKLLECAGCKRAKYCSKECQKNDWRKHKPDCTPFPKGFSVPTT